MPVTGGIVVGGIAVGGLLNYFGGKDQADAASQAQQANAELIQQQMANQQGSAQLANNLLYNAYPQTQEYIGQGFDQGFDLAAQGYGQQRQDLLQSGQNAVGAITQGQGGALDSLNGGAGQGIGYINSGLESGVGALNGRTDRSGAMLDQQGGLYGNLQQDPGFQFRFDQGEQALRSGQAARGGRFGGAAQKELVEYGQNFASNEYNNAAQRRLSEYGAASGADSQSLQAQGQLANLYGGAASQASGMAYGAGQGAANVYSQGGQQLADIYGRTGTQLGTQAASAGATLGGMTQDYYGSLANQNTGLAQSMGQNVMAGAGAAGGMTGAAMANNASTVPYAGQGYAAAANTANNLGQLALLYGASGGFGSSGGGNTTTNFGSGAAQNGPGLSVPIQPTYR